MDLSEKGKRRIRVLLRLWQYLVHVGVDVVLY